MGRLTYGKSRFVYRYSDCLSCVLYCTSISRLTVIQDNSRRQRNPYRNYHQSLFRTIQHTDSSRPQPFLLHHIVLLISLSPPLDYQLVDLPPSRSPSLPLPSPDLVLSHHLSLLYRYMSLERSFGQSEIEVDWMLRRMGEWGTGGVIVLASFFPMLRPIYG